jgi:hypothetical protein
VAPLRGPDRPPRFLRKPGPLFSRSCLALLVAACRINSKGSIVWLAFTIEPTSPDDWVRLAGGASETRASPGALARRAGHLQRPGPCPSLRRRPGPRNAPRTGLAAGGSLGEGLMRFSRVRDQFRLTRPYAPERVNVESALRKITHQRTRLAVGIRKIRPIRRAGVLRFPRE